MFNKMQTVQKIIWKTKNFQGEMVMKAHFVLPADNFRAARVEEKNAQR